MKRNNGTRLQLATAMVSAVLAFGVAHSSERKGKQFPVTVETYGKEPIRRTMIVLHGVSGPTDFYRSQAEWFAAHGYRVLLPHYFDATKKKDATDANYLAWCQAIEEMIATEKISNHDVVVIGYSLGASVALAVGSRGVSEPAVIADFYGSLPDKFCRDLKTMPPVLILHGENDTMIPSENAKQLAALCATAAFRCDMHLYPKEGHSFSPDAIKDADERTLKFVSDILAEP